jgi:large subunit ribosomal protein L23
MGLLERWTKKSKTQQLEKSAEPKSEVKTEEKVKTASATAKKASMKKETKAKKEVSKEAKTETANTTEKVAKIKNDILVRPLVTEKSAVKQSENKYSFVVVNSANKELVKKAVFEVYGVKPMAVNILNVQGKFVRFGNHFGKRSDFKKAIVTLPKGKSIVIHEGV